MSQEQAATTIQKTYRGFFVRQQHQEKQIAKANKMAEEEKLRLKSDVGMAEASVEENLRAGAAVEDAKARAMDYWTRGTKSMCVLVSSCV